MQTQHVVRPQPTIEHQQEDRQVPQRRQAGQKRVDILAAAGRKLDADTVERVIFALVTRRALEPGSKLACGRWVQQRAVVEGLGPGLIPLTVAEVRRLFCLLTRVMQDARHHLRWSWWRRRHQARARWYHQRARLQRQAAGP